MTRVLERVAQLASSIAQNRGEQDRVLWEQWKKNPTDAHASALLLQVNPLIQREANKWSGTLARPLLETEGKRLAMQAFQNYDPTRGAALGTHVVNQLQKMSRLSYANQNVARLPENKMLQFHAYHLAHSELQDALGRPPATDELADHLGWSMRQIEQFRKQTGHQELIESGGVENVSGSLAVADDSDHLVDFIHHDLPPVQKSIFEHLTGYRGAETLNNTQIQKKLNLTQGQYSYLKRKLLDSVEAVHSGKH
jgi:DNA-directed RNA polymerase specialized sigma subunit